MAFALGRRDFGYPDPVNRGWTQPAGEYRVVLASSSRDDRAVLPVQLVDGWVPFGDVLR